MHREKIRFDKLIATKENISREKAAILIKENRVEVEGIRSFKPSTLVFLDQKYKILEPIKYVGRGYIKLKHAIEYFKLDIKDKVCLDVGSSTGGFTQFLLENGASHIQSVDVGYNQMDKSISEDKRVTLLEETNILDVLPQLFDLVVADVSFVSITKLISHLSKFISKDFIVLIKPQFELGNKVIGNRGVVRDYKLIKQALSNANSYIVSNGLYLHNMTLSPILGKKGNIEIFCHYSTAPIDMKSNIFEKILLKIKDRAS